MDIGIGLPNAVRGVDRAGIVDWARRADEAAFLGEYADMIVQSAAKDEDTVRNYLSAFEAAGADEVICFPASPDPEQVDHLARAVR